MKRKEKRRGPLLVVQGALADAGSRTLIREMLKRVDRYVATKENGLAVEMLRALHTVVESRPVSISNCMFK